MPRIKLKKQSIWLLFFMLLITTVAVAQVPASHPIPVINEYGMPAPFLLSWAGIWFFAAAGSIGSTFMKVGDVDMRFNKAHLAKPYLGFFTAISLCVLIAKGASPPSPALMFLAFVVGSGGAIVMQGLLVFLANMKNQAAIIKHTTGVQLEVPNDKEQSK